jgi:GWxTD domain-containing protein
MRTKESGQQKREPGQRNAGPRPTSLVLLVLLFLSWDVCWSRERKPSQLSNPFLSPELSLWLVGPMGYLADKSEEERYLGIKDDEEALRFIDQFWARRDPDPETPGNALRELAEARAVEADRRFTEAGYRGRHTDRGTIFVIYGEPWDTGFEAPVDDRREVEVWAYPPEGVKGLDGSTPEERYRFARSGQFTVFYVQRPGSRRF